MPWKGRELEPTQAAGRLEHWLNVYDSGAAVDHEELSELIELAKREQQRLLVRAPLNAIDKRAGNLLKRIRQVIENGDPARVRKELGGIIDAFGKIDWAKPAVDEAARQLKEFDASQQLLDEIQSEPPVDSNENAALDGN